MAARNQFLGPSLGASQKLTIKCFRCDYVVIMPAEVAISRFGWSATPESVRRRSRCSVCGKSDKINVHTLGGPSNDV